MLFFYFVLFKLRLELVVIIDHFNHVNEGRKSNIGFKNRQQKLAAHIWDQLDLRQNYWYQHRS